jgi:hypothetical protein
VVAQQRPVGRDGVPGEPGDLIRPVVEEVTPAEVASLFQVRVRRVEELTGLTSAS